MFSILNNQPINVLLIGYDASLVRTIRKLFQRITTMWHLWSCYGLKEFSDFTLLDDEDIDLVMIDLSQLSERDPKDVFLSLKAKMQNVPIITLTKHGDDDLISFVMDKGAADNISQFQIDSDPENIINIIKSCIVRNDIVKQQQMTFEEITVDSKARYKGLLREVQERRKDYAASRGALKKDINELKTEISILQKENVKLSDALKEVLDGSWMENDRMDNEGGASLDKV